MGGLVYKRLVWAVAAVEVVEDAAGVAVLVRTVKASDKQEALLFLLRSCCLTSAPLVLKRKVLQCSAICARRDAACQEIENFVLDSFTRRPMGTRFCVKPLYTNIGLAHVYTNNI